MRTVDFWQKVSLAWLAWIILHYLTISIVLSIEWPDERRIAAIKMHRYPIDALPPLSVFGSTAIVVLPAGIVATAALLYRNRNRRVI